MKKKMSFCLLLAMLWTFEANAEKLDVWMDDRVVRMEEEEYLRGVVAAEMPACYESEALKAQAVAARTLSRKGCRRHGEADVCTNSGCCQAFMTQEERLERWGEMAPIYEEKIREAVSKTGSEILLWEGEPILALFHASSGGETEDVELVYASALPYLRGVESPGEEAHAYFESCSVFSSEQIRLMLPDAFEEEEISFEVLERSQSGRILKIRVGKRMMDGRTLRSALGLRSTNVEIEKRGEDWAFLQRGYGHGVGMSQAGAQAMAQSGYQYREILKHYYTGAEISEP